MRTRNLPNQRRSALRLMQHTTRTARQSFRPASAYRASTSPIAASTSNSGPWLCSREFCELACFRPQAGYSYSVPESAALRVPSPIRCCGGRTDSHPWSVCPLGHIPVPSTAGHRIDSAATRGKNSSNPLGACLIKATESLMLIGASIPEPKIARRITSLMAVSTSGSVGRSRGPTEPQDNATGMSR